MLISCERYRWAGINSIHLRYPDRYTRILTKATILHPSQSRFVASDFGPGERRAFELLSSHHKSMCKHDKTTDHTLYIGRSCTG